MEDFGYILLVIFSAIVVLAILTYPLYLLRKKKNEPKELLKEMDVRSKKAPRSLGLVKNSFFSGTATLLVSLLYWVGFLFRDTLKVWWIYNIIFEVLAIFIGIVGIWILIAALREFLTIKKLSEQGQLTDGLVLTTSTITKRTRKSSGFYSTEIHRYVAFSFKAYGEAYLLEQEVEDKEYVNLKEDCPVKVRYLPDHPEIAQMVTP